MAHQIDWMIIAFTIVTLFLVVPVFVCFTYWSWKYRRGRNVDRSQRAIRNVRVELSWTLIPFALTLIFFVWAARAVRHRDESAAECHAHRGDRPAVDVEVPASGRPVGDQRPARAGRCSRSRSTSPRRTWSTRSTSRHCASRWTRSRGGRTKLWFKADRTGQYLLECSEFCGTDHSVMAGSLYVMSPAGYQAWLTRAGAEHSLAAAGKLLFSSYGCSGCHEGNSTVRAPSLLGLCGHPVPMQEGGTIVADRAYVHDKILDPKKQPIAGYKNVMPSFAGKMPEADLLEDHRLHPVARTQRRTVLMSPSDLALRDPAIPAATIGRQPDYLHAEQTLWSWFSTTDHKRIGILYLFAITFFFILGSIAAGMIRLSLLVPDGSIFSNDTYNKMFTLHGVIMVWFFLIPSIPNTFGNFLIPLMIGAKDLAFPRLNLMSWYMFMFASLFTLACVVLGGVDTGWTFYAPFSPLYSNGWVVPRPDRRRAGRVLVDRDGAQLRRHHPHDARARHDLVPDADVRLGAVRHQHHPAAGDPGADDRADPADRLARVRYRRVRPDLWRRSGAVSAHVLVLLAPGGLYHGAAGHGGDERDGPGLRLEEALRLPLRRLFQHGAGGAQLLRLGPPHVLQRHQRVLWP